MPDNFLAFISSLDSRLSNIENNTNLLLRSKSVDPIPKEDDEKIPIRLIHAAKRIGKAPTTVYSLVTSGKLKGHKAGKHWLFYKSDLDNYIKGGGAPFIDPSQYLKQNKKAAR